MSHPPIEHNPHVWADLQPSVAVTKRDVPETPVVEAAEPGSVTVTQDGSASTTPTEGGEQLSASPQETAAPDGTGSSASSNPAEKSDSSSAKQTPSPAPSAASPSAPAAKKAKSTARGATGTGTDQ